MSLFPVLLALWFAGAEPQALQRSPQNQVVEDVRFTNNHRARTETLRYQVQTKKGDILSQTIIQRDMRAIYALGAIDDVKVYAERGENGVIVTFWIQERPYIREVRYEGLKSLTQSEIVDRLRDKKSALIQQTPYDPTKVQHATSLIQVLLTEKGRQDAKVSVSTENVPVNDVIVTFKIDEGPKIHVQKIEFEGNTVFSQRQIRGAMRLVKERNPITMILGQDTYNEVKLGDDITRIRMLYDNNGYIKMNASNPELEVKPTTLHRTFPFGTLPFPLGIPLPFWTKQVDRFYIKIKLEENAQYRVGNVTINGAKVIPTERVRAELGLVQGDVYNGGALRKNVESLRKAYGELGYINFTAAPSFSFDEDKKLVNLKIDLNEDRQFYVHRIAFLGNTTTRDRVIRREIQINEGEVFNSRKWDRSLLRLNQLGYFEPIGPQDAQITPAPSGVAEDVDVTLKVKERGRQTINFNGGVSGIGGSFLGLSYQTNNFLGFGENLQLTAQAGTLQSDYTLGFTEPYLFDRPLATGFSVYVRKLQYNQTQLFGVNTTLPTELGIQDSLNFQEERRGFTLYSSYPVRLFQRVGLTYQFENTSTSAINPATQDYFAAVATFQHSDFINSAGQFSTFRSRKMTPTYTWSTVDSPIQPSRGQSFTTSYEYTGGPFGGNVSFGRPTVEFRFFRPSTRRKNVVALRVMASHFQGFQNSSVPFYERFYMGGDFDIRGFDFRALSPASFLQRQVTTTDSSGNTVTQTIDDIAYVGGDTQGVANFEYRIPIVGPLTLAPFLDIGNTWVTNKDALTRQVTDSSGQTQILPAQFLAGSNSGLRASTGIEFQVIMPVINAPFRLIFAYNPLRLDKTYIGPTTGLPFVISEPNHAIKFTIGRTF
jgi:outer membrane protein insertion porin family